MAKFYFGLDVLVFSLLAFMSGMFSGIYLQKNLPPEKISNIGQNPIFYGYRTQDFTLEESPDPASSQHPFLWLNSGGELNVVRGVAKTIQGELPLSDKWRGYYLNSNPEDTDLGVHPQNIFRLLTKSKFNDSIETLTFRITKDNLSQSKNRNESNGVFLYERFLDEKNSYYLGIRVDGFMVIKKKINGEYITLAEKPFVTDRSYDRVKNPSLIEKNENYSIRAEARNKNSAVELKLFLKRGDEKEWNLSLEALDNGEHGQPIGEMGSGGIRTDFMDVEFERYETSSL